MFADGVVTNPRIMAGKPVVNGTWIPVSVILNLLAHGYDFARIEAAYPNLTADDIRAAIEYSAARVNREEVRRFHRPA